MVVKSDLIYSRQLLNADTFVFVFAFFVFAFVLSKYRSFNSFDRFKAASDIFVTIEICILFCILYFQTISIKESLTNYGIFKAAVGAIVLVNIFVFCIFKLY